MNRRGAPWCEMGAKERFQLSYIPVTESGCWLWLGALASNGYARISLNYKTLSAHRYSYELYRGQIPPGLHIDHLCRVRCCVNPYHLEAVTPQENVLRGVGLTARNAKVTHCKNGHSLSGDNLVRRDKGRSCRTCSNKMKRELRALRRATNE